jgi:hypothetical protein
MHANRQLSCKRLRDGSPLAISYKMSPLAISYKVSPLANLLEGVGEY